MVEIPQGRTSALGNKEGRGKKEILVEWCCGLEGED